MTALPVIAPPPPMELPIAGVARLYYVLISRRETRAGWRAELMELADAQAPDIATTTPTADADVARAQSGDGAAYHRIVRRYQDAIARQMWRFTRDPGQHAQLVQDVFVNAWLSLGGYRGRGPFLHWLRKIALRTGLAHWRQAERNKAAQPLADATMRRLESAPEAASAAEAAELAHHLLAQLPPRDRLVLTLLHLDERSVAEAAELLGWSETLVKVQAWRARRKLKKLVEVDYG